MASISNPILIAIVCIVVAVIAIFLVRKPLRHWQRRKEVQRAMSSFPLQRERLEARFFDMAGSLGKPRGLRWLECDWEKDVTFARSVETGLVTAFVAVNISFEAVEGGDMEEVAAVDTIRTASAVFHFQTGRWGTGGRALFNMGPTEAVQRLEGQYEPVETFNV